MIHIKNLPKFGLEFEIAWEGLAELSAIGAYNLDYYFQLKQQLIKRCTEYAVVAYFVASLCPFSHNTPSSYNQ